ncbi:MAG: hypothetical protein QM655_11340 [Nocardioidaceae bacterium]
MADADRSGWIVADDDTDTPGVIASIGHKPAISAGIGHNAASVATELAAYG